MGSLSIRKGRKDCEQKKAGPIGAIRLGSRHSAPGESEARIEIWINSTNHCTELTGLKIVSILTRDPLSYAVIHSGPSLGLGGEPLTVTAFFPHRGVAHAAAGSVFWP